MKVEFYVNSLSITDIRRIYTRDCRNFQFDVPCSISVESYGMDGCQVLFIVEKALEHIAYVPEILKERRVENFEGKKPCSKITIEELKNV